MAKRAKFVVVDLDAIERMTKAEAYAELVRMSVSRDKFERTLAMGILRRMRHLVAPMAIDPVQGMRQKATFSREKAI